MIEVYCSGCKIAMRGHAGYAPIGQDIVCAGASTLYSTYLYSTKADESVEGEWKVLNAEFNYKNRAIFGAIRTGFEMLSEHYPDHLKLVIGYPANKLNNSL